MKREEEGGELRVGKGKRGSEIGGVKHFSGLQRSVQRRILDFLCTRLIRGKEACGGKTLGA